VRQHDRALSNGLNESQRAQLRNLLATIARQQG
jgi:hypothetical protein